MATFDPTRCGSEPVVPIGTIDLVPDCSIPDGPEQLRQCPGPYLFTPAPKVQGPKGERGDKGDTGPKGETGPAGDDGTNGCTPVFLTPIVTYHLLPAAAAAEVILTLEQTACRYQFTADLGFPVGGGIFADCNLWMWCAGGWVPYIINDVDNITEPPIPGAYDGQSKWVCDCSFSSA